MRKIFLICIALAIGTAVSAQQVANQYHKFDLGLGYSLKKVLSTPGIDQGIKFYQANLNYNFTPWVTAIAEFQNGRMSGIIAGSRFNNSYNSVAARFQVQGGAFIDFYENSVTDKLKNLYIGTGFGLQRFSQKTNIDVPKLNSSNNFFIPMRVGYEIKLFANNATLAKIDLAYQYNLSSNNGSTGFASSAYNDTGHQISVALKFGVYRRAAFGRAIN